MTATIYQERHSNNVKGLTAKQNNSPSETDVVKEMRDVQRAHVALARRSGSGPPAFLWQDASRNEPPKKDEREIDCQSLTAKNDSEGFFQGEVCLEWCETDMGQHGLHADGRIA